MRHQSPKSVRGLVRIRPAIEIHPNHDVQLLIARLAAESLLVEGMWSSGRFVAQAGARHLAAARRGVLKALSLAAAAEVQEPVYCRPFVWRGHQLALAARRDKEGRLQIEIGIADRVLPEVRFAPNVRPARGTRFQPKEKSRRCVRRP